MPAIVHEGSGAGARAQRRDAQRDQVGQRHPAHAQAHGRQQRQRQAQVGAGAGLDQEHVDAGQHLQQREPDALDGAHAARLGAARSRPRQHQRGDQEHAEGVARPAHRPGRQGLLGARRWGPAASRAAYSDAETSGARNAPTPIKASMSRGRRRSRREARRAAQQPRAGQRRGGAAAATASAVDRSARRRPARRRTRPAPRRARAGVRPAAAQRAQRRRAATAA